MHEDLHPTPGNLSDTFTEYPSLLKRTIAAFVDTCTMFLITAILILLGDEIDSELIVLKVAALLIGMSYEPVAMRYSRTVGQIIAGTKLRQNPDSAAGSLLKAYLRFGIRCFLGWMSFLTIHQDRQARAIHDIITGSVVEYAA